MDATSQEPDTTRATSALQELLKSQAGADELGAILGSLTPRDTARVVCELTAPASASADDSAFSDDSSCSSDDSFNSSDDFSDNSSSSAFTDDSSSSYRDCCRY